MKILRRLCALAITACIALSTAACSTGDTTYALTVGEDKIPAGVYMGYLVDSYFKAMDYVDTTKDVWSQKIENKDVKTYIIDNAVSNCLKQYAAVKKFEEMGLTLTDAEKASLKTRADNVWSYMGAIYEKNGCSLASLKIILENDAKAGKIFDSYYGKGGSQEVAEADIKSYFSQNYSLVRIVTISYLDADGKEVTEEVRTERKNLMNGYLERLQKGEDMNNIIKDYLTWVAKQNGSDEPDFSDYNEKSYFSIYNKQDNTLTTQMASAVFDSAIGTPQLVEGSYSLSLVQRSDIMADASYYETYSSSALKYMKTTDFTVLLGEWAAKLTYELNEAAINRYNPRNIKEL